MADAGMNRRTFLGNLAGSILLGSGASWALEPDAEFAFPVLGDLHFDQLDHHDMEWLKTNHPNDVAQVENYSRITREKTQKLLAAVRDRAKASKPPVPFVVQLGDLVEGLCGSEKLAARQSSDVIDLLKKTDFPAPFLFTKGNHDITGPGAVQAYEKAFVPFMAGQAGKEITGAAFARERRGTLIVFYDAYDRGSLDWFAKVTEKEKPKRLIFAIHPPVVPYNARSTWHVYSSPKQAKERERLLKLLGDAKAIVLSGHLHKYSCLVRRTETGRFVQLALSSVANTADAKPRDLLEGVEAYNPDLVKLEPKHSPDTEKARRDALEAERPFIEHFEYADTWGHAMLTVRGESVGAEVFRGMETLPWKSLDLSKLLG
jgi:hypothetical protein